MRIINQYIIYGIAVLIMSLYMPSGSYAQPEVAPRYLAPYALDSGIHNGSGEETVLVFQETIKIYSVPWMRLHFSDYNLGNQSYITLTSQKDGSRQILNAEKLEQWKGSSALFNGDAVDIELYLDPEDNNIYVLMEYVTAGIWMKDMPVSKSLCDGDDDRVASSDSRIGRLLAGGCTGFLISNGAVLTAGHCTDFDPDDGGPKLPDGVLDLNGVMEFNIPASHADGTPVMAAADDQYPIDTDNVTWHYDGSGQGAGKDWSVFAILPNTNNDDRAHITRGFIRMTRESPAMGHTIRITGCGADDDPVGSTGGRNAQNKTEQTDTGTYVGESSSGSNYWHRYRVDTRGASSGSPILWNTYNIALGIHTNGGCGDTSGTNSGTSFEHTPLETAIQNFSGSNAVFADAGMPTLGPAEDGTVFRPYNTVTEAVNVVANNGIVSIVEGSYTKAGNTFTIGADGKRMRLTAPVGRVTIGN
jgi:hypothetical protein